MKDNKNDDRLRCKLCGNPMVEVSNVSKAGEGNLAYVKCMYCNKVFFRPDK